MVINFATYRYLFFRLPQFLLEASQYFLAFTNVLSPPFRPTSLLLLPPPFFFLSTSKLTSSLLKIILRLMLVSALQVLTSLALVSLTNLVIFMPPSTLDLVRFSFFLHLQTFSSYDFLFIIPPRLFRNHTLTRAHALSLSRSLFCLASCTFHLSLHCKDTELCYTAGSHLFYQTCF